MVKTTINRHYLYSFHQAELPRNPLFRDLLYHAKFSEENDHKSCAFVNPSCCDWPNLFAYGMSRH